MSHLNTSVRVAPNRRSLQPGWGWQTFVVCTLNMVSRAEFSKIYDGNKEKMLADYDHWVQTIAAYIVRRTEALGYYTQDIVDQLHDDPNINNPMEAAAWTSGDLAYVWSIWSHLWGPMRQEAITPRPMPMFGFWPRDLKMAQGNSGAYHLMATANLSVLEREAWNQRNISIAVV